jgi:hypothetical protein
MFLSVAKLCFCLQHQAQYARRLGENYTVMPQNVAEVCSILRNWVAKRCFCFQHQAQYACWLGEHYKVMRQNAAWGLKHHAQDGTL